MVALGKAEAEAPTGQTRLRQESWEELEETEAYDAAVAVGVFLLHHPPGRAVAIDGGGRPHPHRLFPRQRAEGRPAKGPLGLAGRRRLRVPATRLARLAEGAGLTEGRSGHSMDAAAARGVLRFCAPQGGRPTTSSSKVGIHPSLSTWEPHLGGFPPCAA